MRPSWSYASFSKYGYLWIEYGERIKEKNGSLTQLFSVHYGRFPDMKRGASLEMEGLRAFYSLREKDGKGEDVFYPLDIDIDVGKSTIRINSLETDNFTVLVEGKRNFGKVKYSYLAKTDFFLFSHSSYKRKKEEPIPYNEIKQRFEISANPEFSYWPQTGSPIEITPLFNQVRLKEKALYMFDENGDIIDTKTNEKGNYTYIPPEDKGLNWKGETAFKQTIIVAEETRQNTNYVSSYTLQLHRSRFKNHKFLPGLGIFCGMLASVFLLVVYQRRKFKL